MSLAQFEENAIVSRLMKFWTCFSKELGEGKG